MGILRSPRLWLLLFQLRVTSRNLPGNRRDDLSPQVGETASSKALKERPIRSVPDAAAHAGFSFPAAANAMRTLERAGVARELTGRRRNRLFTYDRYVNIISEGT